MQRSSTETVSECVMRAPGACLIHMAGEAAHQRCQGGHTRVHLGRDRGLGRRSCVTTTEGTVEVNTARSEYWSEQMVVQFVHTSMFTILHF